MIDVDDDGHNCIVNATSKLTDHKQKTVALVRFVKITWALCQVLFRNADSKLKQAAFFDGNLRLWWAMGIISYFVVRKILTSLRIQNCIPIPSVSIHPTWCIGGNQAVRHLSWRTFLQSECRLRLLALPLICRPHAINRLWKGLK